MEFLVRRDNKWNHLNIGKVTAILRTPADAAHSSTPLIGTTSVDLLFEPIK
jgi:hypothetical protein